jgi:hypothetical protein
MRHGTCMDRSHTVCIMTHPNLPHCPQRCLEVTLLRRHISQLIGRFGIFTWSAGSVLYFSGNQSQGTAYTVPGRMHQLKCFGLGVWASSIILWRVSWFNTTAWDYGFHGPERNFDCSACFRGRATITASLYSWRNWSSTGTSLANRLVYYLITVADS